MKIYTDANKTIVRTLRNVDEFGHYAKIRLNNKTVGVYEVYLSECEDYIWVTKTWMNTTTKKYIRLDDED